MGFGVRIGPCLARLSLACHTSDTLHCTNLYCTAQKILAKPQSWFDNSVYIRTLHAMCAFWCCLLHPPSRGGIQRNCSLAVALFFCLLSGGHIRTRMAVLHCKVSMSRQPGFPAICAMGGRVCLPRQSCLKNQALAFAGSSCTRFDSRLPAVIESTTFKNFDWKSFHENLFCQAARG